MLFFGINSSEMILEGLCNEIENILFNMTLQRLDTKSIVSDFIMD